MRQMTDDRAATDSVGEWYWHVHHDVLAERLTCPLSERIAFIRAEKPAHEIETRLRLPKPVQNTAVLDAYETAVRPVREVYETAERSAREPVEALHKQECPDCPWDGKTIFPAEKKP